MSRLHELEAAIRAASRLPGRDKSIACEEAREHVEREGTCPACHCDLNHVPAFQFDGRLVGRVRRDPGKRLRTVFCSDECRAWWYAHNRSQAFMGRRACERCGEGFFAKTHRATYCSPACRQAAYRGRQKK